MICPNCQARLECADSRPHEGNMIKRRRSCKGCDFITNSLELLLPVTLNHKSTAHIAHKLSQAANGMGDSERMARLLRSLADDLEAA